MIVHKKNKVGIDAAIHEIQTKLYKGLGEKWSFQIDSYPRAYLNQTNEGVSVDLYQENGEYRPIIELEGSKFFFVQGDEPDFLANNRMSNDLFIVFVLNLEEILIGTGRKDEQAHVDVISELQKIQEIESLQGASYGISNLSRLVSRDFNGNMQFGDMHPYHVFYIRAIVQYDIINW